MREEEEKLILTAERREIRIRNLREKTD